MPYFHGTTNARLKPGDELVPGRELAVWSNWTVFEENLSRELASGRVVHPSDVVWVTSDRDEAEEWAHHSTMKALPSEIRQMPAGGIAVYEVEPLELDFPVAQHSQKDAEACCATARVIREVLFEPFDLDVCDGCGEKATVGLGTDNQLCALCAEEEDV